MCSSGFSHQGDDIKERGRQPAALTPWCGGGDRVKRKKETTLILESKMDTFQVRDLDGSASLSGLRNYLAAAESLSACYFFIFYYLPSFILRGQ